MKKVISYFTIIAIFAFVTSSVQAAKPNSSQGPHEKTTGEFTAYSGRTGLTMTIDAHNTDPVKGSVSYSNSLGGNFIGSVDICYKQEDNKAVFAGNITEGTYSSSYKYFIVDVWDKGEGDKAEGPDVVRVRPVNVLPDCQVISPTFPGIVGEGNIQVHKIVEESSEEILSSTVGNSDTCVTIESGLLKNSAGDPITTGFDQWGYNYQAHLFVGGYCDAYRDAAWCQPYSDIQIVMKWNDAWLSNKDCDNDGLLDRHYGLPSYIGSGAWETNHMWGTSGTGDEMYNWNYFTKIVAAPEGATLTEGIWYRDGNEVGKEIWGEFATIQEISNDIGLDEHGMIYKGARPGLGDW